MPCRGNGASVLRIVPYAAFNFGAYEQYRSLLARYVYGSEAETHHIPPILDLLAGSAAGGTAVLMTYPLDLVRTRLAYGTERQRGTGSGSVRGDHRSDLPHWKQKDMRACVVVHQSQGSLFLVA